jgi:F0F1-type ATP synthase membrane subunit b/b'
MRKRILLFTLLASSCLHARQMPAKSNPHESASQELASEDEEAALKRWKVINSGIFFLLVGFALVKFAPKFFQARSLDIQKAIKDATGLKIEADFRYSEIDRRMANLPDEVKRLKAEAAAEMEREHQRLQRDTAEEIQHIKQNVATEVDFLRAEGALQVKQHTAQLALALAERRLQSYFAQNDIQNGVPEFVALVGGKE